MQEQWKEVVGFGDPFEVSSFGRLRANNKLMKATDNGNGYLRINRHIGGKQVTLYVHKLVAQMFIDNPRGLTEVNHLDENKQNNNVANLVWCTHKENCQYGTRNIRAGEKHARAIVCVETGAKYNSVSEAAQAIGCGKTAISNCLNGRSKTSGGYHWEFSDAV